MTARHHRLVAAALLAPALLLLGACSGDSDAKDPAKVLAEAKQHLDETVGVHIVLSTEELPRGVEGILQADGVGTHQPAFDGSIKVFFGGVTASVPIISVDDQVFATLPFTTEFVVIDPADYGAPDPASMMDPDTGLSSWLAGLESAKSGDEVREGDQVLTSFTGTLPGEVVAAVIPSADPEADFDATFTVSNDGVLSRAVVTGPFYPDADDVVYTVAFDEYGTDKTVTAP